MSDQVLQLIIRAVSQGVKEAASQTGGAINTAFSNGKKAVAAFNAETSKSLGGLQGIIKAAMTAGSVLAGIRIGKDLFQAAADIDAINSSFEAITGSASKAAQEIEWVRAQSERLGQNFKTSAMDYKDFAAAAQASGVALNDSHDAYIGVIEASAALKLSQERTTLVVRALGQMMSKGTINFEELKQQMGESLPVAMQIMAVATGKSTGELMKMMEQGQLTAEVLPDFGRKLTDAFGEKAANAIKGPTAQLNLMQNAIDRTLVKLSAGGFITAVTATFQRIATAIENPQIISGLTTIVTKISDIVAAAINLAINFPIATAAIIGIAVVIPILTTIGTVIKGIMAAMSAAGVVAWVKEISAAVTAIDMAAIAAGTLSTAIGAIGGGILAWQIGTMIGDWINSFASVQNAVQSTFAAIGLMIEQLKLKYLTLKQAALDWFGRDTAAVAAEIAIQQTRVDAAQRLLDGYAKAGTEADNLGRKVYKIPPVPEAPIQTTKSLAEQILGSVKGVEDFEKKSQSAYKAAAAAAEDYLEKAKGVRQQAQDVQQSISDALRAIDEASMTESEKLSKMRIEAPGLWQKAQELYAQGVKNNDQEMIKSAYEFQNKSQKMWEELGTKANSQYGAIATSALIEMKRVTAGWAKEQEAYYNDQANKAKGVMNDIKAAYENLKLDPVKLTAEGEQAKAEINEIKKVLAELKDKTITVTVKKVEEGGSVAPVQQSSGGPVGLARGGALSGYGGGDRIRALLEPGEFVIRKEAVRKYGINFFAMLNAMKASAGRAIRASIGGFIGSSTGAQKFAAGGYSSSDNLYQRLFSSLNTQIARLTEIGADEFSDAIQKMKDKIADIVASKGKYLSDQALEMAKIGLTWEEGYTTNRARQSQILNERERVKERVALDLTLNGKNFPLEGDEGTIADLLTTLKRARMGAA